MLKGISASIRYSTVRVWSFRPRSRSSAFICRSDCPMPGYHSKADQGALVCHSVHSGTAGSSDSRDVAECPRTRTSRTVRNGQTTEGGYLVLQGCTGRVVLKSLISDAPSKSHRHAKSVANRHKLTKYECRQGRNRFDWPGMDTQPFSLARLDLRRRQKGHARPIAHTPIHSGLDQSLTTEMKT